MSVIQVIGIVIIMVTVISCGAIWYRQNKKEK
jgi:hypothetical protein